MVRTFVPKCLLGCKLKKKNGEKKTTDLKSKKSQNGKKIFLSTYGHGQLKLA
jgi:hypothetical protein